MKPTKSLPVLFAAVMALGSGTAIATTQNAPADGASGAPMASAQAIKADFRGHRGNDHGRSFGGRGGSDMMQQLFRQVDADGDGNISPEEMDARFGAIVKRMDRNGDGAISSDDRGRDSGRKGDRKNDCKGGSRR